MYKNIIFDIGNVLLDFKPEEYLKKKIFDPLKVQEVFKEIFQSKEWLMLDRGIITEEDAKNIIIKRNSQNALLIELAFENWYAALIPIPSTIEILFKLKNAGYKVYYLSNFHMLAFENVSKNNDFFKLFDGGIVSFEEKFIKPEEQIYKRIIAKYQLNPQESIFIDDIEENINAAQKQSFNTILLENPQDLNFKLKAFDINLLDK